MTVPHPRPIIQTALIGALIALLLTGCATQKPKPTIKNKDPIPAFVLPAPLEPLPTPGAASDGWNQPSVAAYQNTIARMQPAQWSDLPPFKVEEMPFFWPAFLRNCRMNEDRIAAKADPKNTRMVPPQVWNPICQKAKTIDVKNYEQQYQFIRQNLRPWMITANNQLTRNLITSYYEPIVQASRVRGGVYQWPLYAKPKDLVAVELDRIYPEFKGSKVRGRMLNGKITPYPTRAELSKDARSLEAIVWVNDPIDAFFLQVQGSGRAYLTEGPDQGSIIRLAYADQNGHPYQSIGQWLIDQKELPASQANAEGIKRWIQQNPQRTQELLNINPSVIFFKEERIQNEPGPKGAYGVPLTPQRSVAVDPQWIPLGTPLLIRTQLPDGYQTILQKLVIAQDTGSAIKGPGRVDFYAGTGKEAGDFAGRLKQWGNVWILWPNGSKPPNAL